MCVLCAVCVCVCVGMLAPIFVDFINGLRYHERKGTNENEVVGDDDIIFGAHVYEMSQNTQKSHRV